MLALAFLILSICLALATVKYWQARRELEETRKALAGARAANQIVMMREDEAEDFWPDFI